MADDLILYFRELNTGDIPRIKEMCRNIWDGDDYLPQVIEQWLVDDESHNYGAFLDSQTNKLIGSGRIKWLSNILGWIEGGRVAQPYQNQGLGFRISKYAVEYAKEHGAKSVQYDTWTENRGSCALAKAHGFIQKDYVDVMYTKTEELHIPELTMNFGAVRSVEANEMFHFLNSVENGPKKEINMGWNFLPFELSHLQKNDKKYEWRCNRDAGIQIRRMKSNNSTGSSPKYEVWLILYGSPEAAREILIFELTQLKHELVNSLISVEIFFPPFLRSAVGGMGFHWVEFPHPSGIVLYEKKF